MGLKKIILHMLPVVSSYNIKGMSVIDDTHDFQSNILLEQRTVDHDSQQRGGIK